MAEGIFGAIGAPIGSHVGEGKSLAEAQQAWFNAVNKTVFMQVPLGQVEAKIVYKTQKARGLEIGWVLSQSAGYGYKVAPHNGVLPYLEPHQIKGLAFPKFARPCPVVPRHGFVESRLVKNVHELEALFEETRREDPLGEMIVMDKLTGLFSAVMTATGVAWGLSNDGVTGGKGENKVIPCPAGRFDSMFLPYLGVKADSETDGVYCELVEDKGAVCVVQMRLGPKQPDSRIKRVLVSLACKITKIYEPTSDDLIVWDQRLKANKGSAANTLVWLPGQTMSSHFAVQGIANGYNVSVEEECPVKAGQVLRTDTSELAPLTDDDYEKLGHMFEAEKTTRFWDFPRDVLLSVGVLHSLPFWGNEQHLLALRARGAMIAARYGLAACLGESRHHPRMSTNPTRVPWKQILDEDAGPNFRPSRSYVFVRTFSTPWELGAKLALAAAEDMRIADQPPVMEHLAKGGKLGDYSASFMGQKWEWAALRVHDLHVAIDRFCKDATQANWNAVLGHYNEIINASHNGGYLLNKWCSPALIDNAACAPALVFGFRNVMNLMWGNREDEPRVAWMPLSQKPIKAAKFVETNEGMLIPSEVWAILETDGVVDAINQCKCDICMAPKWKSIGQVCIEQGLPTYVPDAKFSHMPKVSTEKDNYSMSIESVIAPSPDSDPEEDATCGECGDDLINGECANSFCPNSPEYECDDEEEAPTPDETEEPDGDELPKV